MPDTSTRSLVRAASAPPVDLVRPQGERGAAGPADILTLGFGTTAAMWCMGFLGRLPGAALPSWALFLLLLGCLFAGGLVAGRYGRRGVRSGLYTGLLAGALNVLILGSLLGGGRPNQIAIAALLWLPGWLLASMAIATIGAAIAHRPPREINAPPNWLAAFALVAAGATLILLAVGGSVTGYDYGLAVVDWPNTEGYSMFLYPLARMTGGIYYEHSHRLIGSLVGLTTLVLALQLQFTEPRRWLRLVGWVALALVVIQGILGGLRVTGRFTLSTDPHDTAPNIALAIVHGIVGQVFLAVLVAIAVILTMTWVRRRHAIAASGASTDRVLGVLLAVMLLVQLVLGALVRHLTPALQRFAYGLSATPEELIRRGSWALHLHVTMAVLVTLAAIMVGVRLWGLYAKSPLLRRLGVALMILIGVQVALGLTALLAIGSGGPGHTPSAFNVLITTGHQIAGAVLLALAVAATLSSYRLLMPAEELLAANAAL